MTVNDVNTVSDVHKYIQVTLEEMLESDQDKDDAASEAAGKLDDLYATVDNWLQTDQERRAITGMIYAISETLNFISLG